MAGEMLIFHTKPKGVNVQIEKYPNDTLGIVSHGTVMTLLTSYYNAALDPFTFWQNLLMPDIYELLT